MLTFALMSLAVATVLGSLTLVVSLKNAPVGYEDETGFHFGAKTDEAVGARVVPAPRVSPARTPLAIRRNARRAAARQAAAFSV